MGNDDGRENEGVEFGEFGYDAFSPLSLDERVALITRATRRVGGENLVAAIEFARYEAEVSGDSASEWMRAVERAAGAGVITRDVAFLFEDAIVDGHLADEAYHDEIVETLLDEMRDIEAALDADSLLGADPNVPMPTEWQALDRRLTERLEGILDAFLEDHGADEMVRRWRDDPRGFATHIESVRVAVHAEAGLPLRHEYANARPRCVTGYRILDELCYTIYRAPTTDECVFLIESAVLGRGDATLADVLNIAESLGPLGKRNSDEKSSARRWIEAARRLRDTGVLSRDLAFVFVDAAYDRSFRGAAFDDVVAQAISAEQKAFEELHGMEDIRDADPTWSAPDAWWALNRRWHARIDQLQCEFLRAVGEDELAALVERIGGNAFDREIGRLREAMDTYV